MLLLNHHIFVLSSKNKVLLIYSAFIYLFIYLKDNKLKKLAVALKFLTVLSLNSNVFC